MDREKTVVTTGNAGIYCPCFRQSKAAFRGISALFRTGERRYRGLLIHSRKSPCCRLPTNTHDRQANWAWRRQIIFSAVAATH